jgi:hypothetical protein
MPWKAVSLMSLRKEFATLAEVGVVTLSELCRRFGISRKTGYKWLKRYRRGRKVCSARCIWSDYFLLDMGKAFRALRCGSGTWVRFSL